MRICWGPHTTVASECAHRTQWRKNTRNMPLNFCRLEIYQNDGNIYMNELVSMKVLHLLNSGVLFFFWLWVNEAFCPLHYNWSCFKSGGWDQIFWELVLILGNGFFGNSAGFKLYFFCYFYKFQFGSLQSLQSLQSFVVEWSFWSC